MHRLLPTFFALFLAVNVAVAADLPPDFSHEPWFIAHCRPLSEDRVSHYADVKEHRISYAWQSDLGYLWDWEHGAKAATAAHYCTRLALYGAKGRFIENVTMLCSVTDRGQPTEVWMFGNSEVAGRLCQMDSDSLKKMDDRSADH